MSVILHFTGTIIAIREDRYTASLNTGHSWRASSTELFTVRGLLDALRDDRSSAALSPFELLRLLADMKVPLSFRYSIREGKDPRTIFYEVKLAEQQGHA